MARLTDPERLANYGTALRNWECSGVISYTRRADEWIRENLSRCTQVTLNNLLYDYIFKHGGYIDEVVESREEWKKQWEFHHDMRIAFRGKTLYFETRLCWNPFDPKVDPTIIVANVHWA